MIGMTLQAAKGGFFDREKVKRSVDAGTQKVLSKFGAFVRVTSASACTCNNRLPSTWLGRGLRRRW
jgi:hypothetical protein